MTVDFGYLNKTGPIRKHEGDGLDKAFIAFLMTQKGNNAVVAHDMANVVKRVFERYNVKFPNAARLNAIAGEVLLKENAISYKRKILIALERYAEFYEIRHKNGSPVRFKLPRIEQKEIEYLTVEEMKTLVRAAKSQRDLTILVLLCKTGVRVSELRGLNISDIDLDRKTIQIRLGKGYKARLIDIDEQMENILRIYFGSIRIRGETDPLFRSREGGRLSKTAIESMVKKTGESVGLRVYPHKLRHSFATAWVSNGGDVFNLQNTLGHSSPVITRRYWHSCPETRREAYLKSAPRL